LFVCLFVCLLCSCVPPISGTEHKLPSIPKQFQNSPNTKISSTWLSHLATCCSVHVQKQIRYPIFRTAPFPKRRYLPNHTASFSHYDNSQTIPTAAVNLTCAQWPPSAPQTSHTHTQAALKLRYVSPPSHLLPKEATSSFCRSRALSIFILRLYFRYICLTHSLSQRRNDNPAGWLPAAAAGQFCFVNTICGFL